MIAGLLVLASVAGLAVISQTTTGCKSTPPSAVAGKTLDSIGASVDAAMKTAALLKTSGKISSDQWQTIANAHAKYLAGYNAAIDAAAVAVDKATVPANVSALAADVINLVQAFNK